MRSGVEMDYLQPPCTCAPEVSRLPPQFDGDLLQIMPRPIDQRVTDHDLRAIYEYLSAVPFSEGPPAPSPPHND
jgi:hypothetical protein